MFLQKIYSSWCHLASLLFSSWRKVIYIILHLLLHVYDFSKDRCMKQYHFERLVSIWIVWNVISWSHSEGTDASHTFKLRTLYSLKETKWTSICVLWYEHYSCLLFGLILDRFLDRLLTYFTNNIFLLRLKVLRVSDKRIFCCNSVPHQALQASPDSENLFYYHDEMNGESPPVITTGQKDSIVPASVSDIRIYGNSENYFW